MTTPIPTTTVAKSRAPQNTYVRNAAGALLCPTCGVTKNRHNTMFYHMKKHTGEKKYSCTECDSSFVQKSGLDHHRLVVHSPTQMHWNCPCCAHVCHNKYNMLIHIGRRHGEGWIPALLPNGGCPGCKKTFASATAYSYHATSCFGEDAPFSLELLCTVTSSESSVSTAVSV